MPGFILHQGAAVMCEHGGQAIPNALFPKVLVNNLTVATQAGPYAVAGCGLTGSGPACVTGFWITASTKVFAGGQPVVIVGGQAKCAASGGSLVPVSFQTRVVAT